MARHPSTPVAAAISMTSGGIHLYSSHVSPRIHCKVLESRGPKGRPACPCGRTSPCHWLVGTPGHLRIYAFPVCPECQTVDPY